MNNNNFNYRALLEQVNQLQKDTVINVLSAWMEGWKKMSDIEAQFTKFIESPNHGANMVGGIFEQVWFYLLWNFFKKEQINSNGLIKELYEIMSSVDVTVLQRLSGGFTKENVKKLIIGLYGTVNAIYGNIIKKNYTEAAKAAQIVFDRYMNQPGFAYKDPIFTKEAQTRMKTFINMLSSPTLAASTASEPAQTKVTGKAMSSRGAASRSTEPQADMAKLKANVSKLID